MRDLGYVGQWWTWERGRTVETRVRERLDRFLVSPSWLRLFPQANVEHLLRYKSDHCPIVIKMVQTRKGAKKGRKEFKFENRMAS